MPLKDAQIKVAERTQVLIRQGAGIGGASAKTSASGSPVKLGTRAGFDKFGQPKKESFKEYDLKTNQIVEVRKKKKLNNYASDSDASVER